MEDVGEEYSFIVICLNGKENLISHWSCHSLCSYSQGSNKDIEVPAANVAHDFVVVCEKEYVLKYKLIYKGIKSWLSR